MFYEHDPFLWLNAAMASPALDGLALFLTYLGTAFVVVPVAFVIIALLERRRAVSLLVHFALGLSASGIFLQALKALANTPRPLRYYASALATKRIAIHVVGAPLYSHSFPSGHAETAFFVATFFTLRYGANAAWSFVLAAMVALSRIYVGAHFGLDVLTGAALGSAFAWATVRFTDRAKAPLTPAADGS
jgi:undecaprenyl-diphosphatase